MGIVNNKESKMDLIKQLAQAAAIYAVALAAYWMVVAR